MGAGCDTVAPTPLSDNIHSDLLIGYDLPTNIFNVHSKLWLIPIV